MDWNNIWLTFFSSLAGGGIALAGTYISNKNQNKLLKTQLEEQNKLFEKQISYKQEVEQKDLLNKKIENATILYNLIPEIAWEAYQIYSHDIYYPSAIFNNYDYMSALDILRDEFGKYEILYLIKLFSSLEVIKKLKPNSNEFKESSYRLFYGFCNGFVNCGTFYIQNKSNGNKLPSDKISENPIELITKDVILETSNSDFINSSHNDIYTKLEKIQDY